MISRLRTIWPWLTLLVSGGLLAGAHVFQALGYFPCDLCLKQREWHWGVVGVSAAALILLRFRPSWTRWAVLAIGVVLAGATYWAGFHVGVEKGWFTWVCGADVDFGNLDMSVFGDDRPIETPQCDEVAWQWFGISMAGFNALISGAATLATFTVALLPERKP